MNEDLERAKHHFQLALNALNDENFFNAESELREANQLTPDRASILTNLSAVLVHQHKWSEAIYFCTRLLNLEPNNLEGLINLGVCQLRANEPDAALVQFNRAIEVDPLSPLGWVNKANILLEQELFLEARACFLKSLELDPNSEESLIGLGNLYNEQKEYRKALECLSSALAINPNNAQAQWNKALSLLRLGFFNEGWKLYEARWLIPGMREHAKQFTAALWHGKESLKDKTILIYAEQGYGDTVQFARYVPLIESMGAKVIFQVQKPLLELMSTLSTTVEVVEDNTQNLQKYFKIDFYCPIMSLALAFNTATETIPENVPYLFSDMKKRLVWREKLSKLSSKFSPSNSKPLRVGITWSGSGHYAGKKNLKRDIPYALIKDLLSTHRAQNIEFHCLHPEINLEVINAPHHNLFMHCNDLGNFSDTASLMDELDIILSTDTASAHLAGSLNKECLLLLPDPPDFMSLVDREDSPWYPSIRLLRQVESRNWMDPLNQVSQILNLKVNDRT